MTRAPLAGLLARFQAVQGMVLGGIMICMTFGYAGNVLVRELAPALASYLAWIDEMALFGLVYIVFLSVGLALEAGRHISMRLVYSRMSGPARRLTRAVVDLLGLTFSLYLVKVGYEITAFVARSGQSSPTLGISMAWLYWVVPLGFGLLAAQYLLELVGLSDRYSREVDPSLHQ